MIELPLVADACTLPTEERPLRVAEFDALFASALRGVERLEPRLLRLVLATEAEATARDLAARETTCCSFFGFDISDAGQGRLLVDVSVPAGREQILDAMERRAETALTR